MVAKYSGMNDTYLRLVSLTGNYAQSKTGMKIPLDELSTLELYFNFKCEIFSILRSLQHAAAQAERKLKIIWLVLSGLKRFRV